MLRRNTLAYVGAGALLPLLAQAQPQGQLTQHSQSGGNATRLDPNQLRMEIIEGSTFLLRTAQLGAQRASNQMLKQFGQLEAEEQQANMQAMQLARIQMPSQVAASGSKLQQLQQLEQQSGQNFDQLFIQAQMNGHQQALQLMQQLAQSGQSEEERIIGTLNVPAIRSHLVMLETIRSMRT
jgi:putative membrane protein